MGIYEKLRAVSSHYPNKLAVVCNNEQIHFGELLKRVDLAASNIAKINPGVRRVAVNFANSIELAVLALALAKLGLTIVPLNPSMRRPQLLKQINVTCCDMLICADSAVDLWRTSLDSIHVLGMGSLFSESRILDRRQHRTDEKALESAYIITLSSGSTGQPKPIVLSQKAKLLRAEQARSTYQIDENEVILCASPFFHSLGQRLFFLPLLYGATLVILEHFSAKAWLQAVAKYKVSFTIAVSSHLQALGEDLLNDTANLKSLRCLVSSSALLSQELKNSLFENLGCEFHEMYGATEIATATNLSRVDAQMKPGSVGRALAGVSIKILNEEGIDCDTRESGEIACYSPMRFSLYDAKPRETRAAFVGDYFLTGDLGYLDEDGFLYFVSRKKDIIITGGINVIPADIETELLKFPEIRDCCVIGVDDSYLGEAILAVCVLRDGSEPGEDLTKRLCLELNISLAGFQQPRAYEFVSAIPVTGSGKPDKEKLRNVYRSIIAEKVYA